MLYTRVCDLLRIEYPIFQAGMAVFTSAELVAAVSNAGGLGILGAAARPYEDLVYQLKKTQQLTNRPFGVNFQLTRYSEEAFELALKSKVPFISTALGDPGDLVKRVHDAGGLYAHQVHTRAQAIQARRRGVDIIVAQGAEAGGEGQSVAALPLIPQVVDAVNPVPVVATGGIADGRGVAAALILGAEGAQLGTRFLASAEAPIGEQWKKMIVSSESEDAIKIDFARKLMPVSSPFPVYDTIPRALRTPFIEKLAANSELLASNIVGLREELMKAFVQNRIHEYVPYTGQTTGLIRDILPAGEIVKRIVSEARATLDRAGKIGTSQREIASLAS